MFHATHLSSTLTVGVRFAFVVDVSCGLLVVVLVVGFWVTCFVCYDVSSVCGNCVVGVCALAMAIRQSASITFHI